MVLVCVVAIVYYFYRKKHPTYSYRGHIENFAIPERIPRRPILFGRILGAVFPRLKVREEDTPEDEQLQEVVAPRNLELASGSRPGSDRDLSGDAPPCPRMVLPPVLRRPSVYLPGMVVETDVDEGAKVMAPQRPRTGNPRQALWHSSVNSGSVENSADTVTTERLGTISRSRGRLTAEPSEALNQDVKVTPEEFGAKPCRHTAEYPQRPDDDSVFDEATSES